VPVDDDVVIDWHGATTHAAWAGASVDARLPVQAAIARTVPIDVAFVLDTTGSMSDEIDRIRATLGQVVAKLGGGDRPIDLRIGAVLYRDHGDEYLTRVEPLTADVGAFRRKLDDVSAGGGGDEPEALNVGLSQAVHQLQWRQDAARVAFLIADAGPHMEIDGEVPYLTSSRDAAGAGLRVHTVAASGLPQSGTLVFRQVAAVTRGQFVFIEYGGSVAATAASHGVANPEQVSANNLDQILYDRVKAEVDGWGVR
ncbi:MAG TPA: VWA domain-containing protein, partial [Myxococcota bacterium]|nr:VWA domain-containing protein [Myxococcota bacterium]